MTDVLDDLASAMRAWPHLASCGLGSEVVWHALFSPWNLCDCPRCTYDADDPNGNGGRHPTEASDDRR